MKCVFIFPQAAGHLNPSLALARRLVSLGWTVEYLSVKQFQEAIEDTGAIYFDRDVVCAEYGIANLTEMTLGTFREYNDKSAAQWALNFGSIATCRLLPIYIQWFTSRAPDLIVYCPVLSQVAHFAALRLGIADCSLLTAAGPGFYDAAMAAAYGADKVRSGAASLVTTIRDNKANMKAIDGIRTELGMSELTLNTAEPLIRDHYTSINLVTTTVELADNLCGNDADWYSAAGKEFVYVGPLLDISGAKRGVGSLLHSSPNEIQKKENESKVMSLAEAAVAFERAVIYVSMGTVITGDSEEHGWNAKDGSCLTGRQLCQAVYRAVFAEFGVDGDTKAAPLIIVSIGPQSNALDGVEVPSNACCVPYVPQVDLLRRTKPILMVTNGGQNSLMEAASVGTPVVICPGFGDQIGNAGKVQQQGWGVKVDRPPADNMDDAEMIYMRSVQCAICTVRQDSKFATNAKVLEDSLKKAPGVDGAVQILVNAASQKR